MSYISLRVTPPYFLGLAGYNSIHLNPFKLRFSKASFTKKKDIWAQEMFCIMN